MRAGFIAAALLLSGCGSRYLGATASMRRAYAASDYDVALARLGEAYPPGKAGIHQLLTLMDRGMVLHAAGRWPESIAVLAEADALAQKLDYVSVSEEAGAMLANEATRTYRGEDFEKLLISVLQALNYAQSDNSEDAMVEVRRVHERLERMVRQEKKPYEQLAVAHYLAAVLHEDRGEQDDAALDYGKALHGGVRGEALYEPLLRLAQETRREDLYREALARAPGLAHAPLQRGQGQVVVIFETGAAPEKSTNQREVGQSWVVVPVYAPRHRSPPACSVATSGQQARASVLTSLDTVARQHLEERIGRLIARSAGSLALKAGAAVAVGAVTRSRELGVLTFLLLGLTQGADTRSWLTLPAEFQVARLKLPVGTQRLTLSAGGWSEARDVKVRPGRTTLLVVRVPR